MSLPPRRVSSSMPVATCRDGAGAARHEAALARREADASSGAPPIASISPGAATRASAGSRGRLPRCGVRLGAAAEHVAEGARPTARRTSSRVSELSLAVFASETGDAPDRPPRGERWRGLPSAIRRARVSRATRCRRGHRFFCRVGAGLPTAAACDPRSAGWALPPFGVANPELLAQPAVAIVGARASSGYGASVARSLAGSWHAAGSSVVSGLARGVAPSASRDARGKGDDRRSPRLRHRPRLPAAHAELARRVADSGPHRLGSYAPGR
jgi:hypothetical protein